MQIFCGIDITEVSRMGKALSRNEEAFLRGTFTPREIEYCNGKKDRSRLESFAARFAAKEAAGKALGTGVMAQGIRLTDIEIDRDCNGMPVINLMGKAEQRAKELGIVSMSVSLSHDAGLAIAYVTMLGSKDEEEQ